MGALNELYKIKVDFLGKNEVWQKALESIVTCVAPFAPHIVEELWQQLGHSTTVHVDTWPKAEAYSVSDTINIVVQVNGRLRANLALPTDVTEEQVIEAAKADAKVAVYLKDQQIKKTIYVPGKLVNFVV